MWGEGRANAKTLPGELCRWQCSPGSGCETVSLCALRRLTVAKQRDSANGYLASLLEARSKVMITLDIRANR